MSEPLAKVEGRGQGSVPLRGSVWLNLGRDSRRAIRYRVMVLTPLPLESPTSRQTTRRAHIGAGLVEPHLSRVNRSIHEVLSRRERARRKLSESTRRILGAIEVEHDLTVLR